MQLTDVDIQRKVIDILQDTIQDWDLDLEEVGPKTQLVEDLFFSSIDIIHFIVSVENYFKQKLGFEQLLMQSGRYVDDLSVEQLVTFISQKIK